MGKAKKEEMNEPEVPSVPVDDPKLLEKHGKFIQMLIEEGFCLDDQIIWDEESFRFRPTTWHLWLCGQVITEEQVDEAFKDGLITLADYIDCFMGCGWTLDGIEKKFGKLLHDGKSE